MRRPRTVLAFAVVMTAVLSSSVVLSQSPSRRYPPRAADADADAAENPTAAASAAMAGRSARHLLRNGKDYLDYREYELALSFLKEADSRRTELSPAEQRSLRAALEKARKGLREVSTVAARGVSAKGAPDPRPGAFALADPTTPPRDGPASRPSPEPIQLAAGTGPAANAGNAPAAAEDADKLPPLPPDPEDQPSPLPSDGEPVFGAAAKQPSAPATAANVPARDPNPAIAEPAPAATTAPEPLAEPPALGAPPADAPRTLSLETPDGPSPVSSPTPAPKPAEADSKSKATPAPAPAPTPASKPVEDDEPLPELPTMDEPVGNSSAPIEIGPLMTPTQGVENGASQAPAEREVTPASAPGPDKEPTAASDRPIAVPSLSDEPAASPEPRTAAAPAPATSPDAGKVEEDLAPLPEPATAVKDAPPASSAVPVPDESPEAAGPGARAEDSDPLPVLDEPEPTPSPRPRPGTGRDVDAPRRAPSPAATASRAPARQPNRSVIGPVVIPQPPSTLAPHLEEEVARLAQRQDEDNQRNNAAARESAGSTRMGMEPLTGPLALPRAPSPTEARPIKAIPTPEEFVPISPRFWNPSRKYWAAAATCHLPLYFQDAALERYGQSVEQAFGPKGRFLTYPIDDPAQTNQRVQIFQPVISLARFYGQIALLPYNLIVDPPNEPEYDLGYYRPGDRIPTDTVYFPWFGVGPPLRGRNY